MNASKKLEFDVLYDLGAIVYLRIKDERQPGMVTGFTVRQNAVIYLVSWPDGNERGHYEMELSSEFVPNFE